MDEQYLEALQEIAGDKNTLHIPDKVKEYTHDVHGKKLPCKFIQMNEQVYYHIDKIYRNWINNNYDYVGLVFGYAGAGKSHFMQRVATLLNADFSLNDITFTPKQFDEWVTNAKEGSVCIFDEADVMAEHHAKTVLTSLIRNMKRIRTKKLIIFLVTTNMGDMHKYFASRARVCYYVKLDENNPANRGYINMWHRQDLIADLFARIKKAYSEHSRVYESTYKTLQNKYIGRMIPPDWHINEEEYEAKKEAARKEGDQDKIITASQVTAEQIKAVEKFCTENKYLITQKMLAKFFGVTQPRISQILNEKQEDMINV